jgi:hypothetical protein
MRKRLEEKEEEEEEEEEVVVVAEDVGKTLGSARLRKR